MSRFNYSALAQDLSILVGRKVGAGEAIAVKRDMQRHQSLMEAACNGDLTPRQQACEYHVEKRLRAFFGERLRAFNGDPRGATIKLYDPRVVTFTYFSRDWGGDLIFTGYRR